MNETKAELNNYCKLKRSMEKVIPLKEPLWESVKNKSTIINLKKNEYLLRAGSVCSYGYFINKGCLLHMYLKEDGEQVVIGFSDDKNHPFVSSTSYFTRKDSEFELLAVEDCQLLSFSKKDLESLAYENRDFSVYYQYIMSQGLIKQYKFTALRLSLSSEELFTLLQNEFKSILERIPDKYIARFMGISQEWYCKIKKRNGAN